MASRPPRWLSSTSLQLPSWFPTRLDSINWTEKSKSKSELLYDGQFTANQFFLAPNPSDIASERTQQKTPFLCWCGWRGITCSIATAMSAWCRTAWLTPLPAGLLLLRDVIPDVTFYSLACAVVTLISCLLCRNLATAYMLQYYNSFSD
jgi:hypothetical protein